MYVLADCAVIYSVTARIPHFYAWAFVLTREIKTIGVYNNARGGIIEGWNRTLRVSAQNML